MSSIEKKLTDIEEAIKDIRHDIAEDKEEIWLTPTRRSFGNNWAGVMGLTCFDRVLLVDANPTGAYTFSIKTRKGSKAILSHTYFEETQTLAEASAMHDQIK